MQGQYRDPRDHHGAPPGDMVMPYQEWLESGRNADAVV
jgi:hypothetical protein